MLLPSHRLLSLDSLVLRGTHPYVAHSLRSRVDISSPLLFLQVPETLFLNLLLKLLHQGLFLAGCISSGLLDVSVCRASQYGFLVLLHASIVGRGSLKVPHLLVNGISPVLQGSILITLPLSLDISFPDLALQLLSIGLSLCSLLMTGLLNHILANHESSLANGSLRFRSAHVLGGRSIELGVAHLLGTSRPDPPEVLVPRLFSLPEDLILLLKKTPLLFDLSHPRALLLVLVGSHVLLHLLVEELLLARPLRGFINF